MTRDYENFLSKFKKNDYIFKFFHQKIFKKRNIILRHDVDFDTDYALNIAKIEKKLKIKSTFFFLLEVNHIISSTLRKLRE